MNILFTFILAVVIGYIAYLISTLVVFLAGFAAIVGLVVFVLVLLGGYNRSWIGPRS